ncbi:MAG: asparagine synthase (glutamine-hydrolyzing) [Thermodesulfobacteriota bacterium]|nr:asparagine synthase (glutamine-hydrolyzing) [Thermodesulfobacteriota bacterium]
MCGIAGIINFSSKEDMQDLLRRMIGLLHHRGPDASGIYVDSNAGLAHARLSIIDLSGGVQPIYNEDQSVWIVFNGEIFNYPELREGLILRGHRFYTQTDTEVMVHLYEEQGPEMIKNLNGQFAFALWDQKKKNLMLGRDRMGIRPLFYHQRNGRLVFGSEIKALFADPLIPRKLDTQTLSDIFTCWTPVNFSTPFEDIKQVPPGHYAMFGKKGFNIHRYWKLSFNSQNDENPDKRSLSEWTEELKDLLRDSARIRLRADVPVGAYLSGGLDSTYTSALVKQNFNNLLRTFSVSFTDSRFDETSFQKTAVKALKTEHRDIRCSEKDIGDVFPQVIWHTEAPILRTAPAPLYHLSKLVRENNFKVVLTGEGADEIFAGYNIFKEDRVRRFWARNPDSVMRPMLLERLYPYIFARQKEKAKAFLEGFFKRGLLETDSPAYSHLLRWENTSRLKNFFSAELQKETDSLNSFFDRFVSTLPSGFMSWHPLSRAQYTEVSLFLSNYLLSSQGDRMAMANSVEGRYPFLDHRVVEFATRVPPAYRMNGLKEKFILKQAARGIIPTELIDRPKQPYRAPISKCFFQDQPVDYVEDLLCESAIRKNGYFDPKKVSHLTAKCRDKDGQILSERENMALVGILSTQLLDHQFIGSFQAFPVQKLQDVKIFNLSD